MIPEIEPLFFSHPLSIKDTKINWAPPLCQKLWLMFYVAYFI